MILMALQQSLPPRSGKAEGAPIPVYLITRKDMEQGDGSQGVAVVGCGSGLLLALSTSSRKARRPKPISGTL